MDGSVTAITVDYTPNQPGEKFEVCIDGECAVALVFKRQGSVVSLLEDRLIGLDDRQALFVITSQDEDGRVLPAASGRASADKIDNDDSCETYRYELKIKVVGSDLIEVN